MADQEKLAAMVLEVAGMHTSAVLSLCDRHGLVCSITVEIQRKNGERVWKVDAHGEHELEGC